MPTAKMRYCFNCGEEIGVYADYDRLDDCGKMECQREVRHILAAEREEAHDQLDRDLGY